MAVNAGTAYVEVVGDFSKLNAQIASQTGLLSSKFGKMGKAGALGFAAIAAGGVAAGKALYDLGKDFDDAYDTIRQTTGKTGRELDRLKKDFRNVVGNVPASFEDAATAVAQFNQRLGVSGKPLDRLSKQILELSRMTGTDLDNNIRQVARAFKDWEVPIRDQSRVLDGFFRLSQKTGVAVGDLAESIVRFGAPLRNFGFTLDQASAMFAEFEQSGVNMTTLLSGLRLATGNLAKPTADLTKRLHELGLAGKEPQQQFLGVVDAIEKTRSRQEALSIAIDVFGKRAANDLVEAVKQGRFNLDDLIATMDHGKGTILGTAAGTRDFGENMKILGNRVKLFLEGPATALYKFFGDLSRVLVRLSKGNFRDLQKALGLTRKDMKALGEAARVVGKVLGVAFQAGAEVAKKAIKSIVDTFRAGAKIIAGVVRIVSAVLRGDFGDAWRAVKDIFRTGIRLFILEPLRVLKTSITVPLKFIGKAMSAIFGSAWDRVERIFESGANAVISVVNKIIDAINVIPGVPDIPHVGEIGGGGGRTHRTRTELGQRVPQGRYSGGPITKPTAIVGEEAPRHHEWVIATNPAYRQNNLAYWAQAGRDLGVPGFFGGGLVGTGIDIATKPFTAPVDIAKTLVGKGASFFISRLPTPHLPEWLSGLGAYLINKVSEWIKSGFASGELGAKGPKGTKGPKGVGTYAGLPMANWVIESLKYAAGKGIAPRPTSGYRSHAYNVSQGRNYYSEHEGTQYPHGAVDFGGYNTGLAAKMSVVGATRDFKYPLLAPIGFHDDGHASGTGHRKGGILFRKGRPPLRFRKGGRSPFSLPLSGPGLKGWRSLGMFDSTSYGPPWNAMQGTGVTSQGTDLRPAKHAYIVAIDPSVVSYGSKLKVHPNPFHEPQAIFLADDTGGAITGKRIDIYNWKGRGAQYGWGRKPVHVWKAMSAAALSPNGEGGGGKKPKKPSSLTAEWGRLPALVSEWVVNPGLPRTVPIPPSASKLPGGIRALLRGGGLSYELLMKIAGLAISSASHTPRSDDDAFARRFQLDLEKARLRQVRGKLSVVTDLLRGNIPRSQRLTLTKARNTLIGLLISLRNDIGAGMGRQSGEQIETLRLLLQQANLRTAVSEAQFRTLMPFAGSFRGGGIVPGPAGQPQVAVMHGREGVFTPDQMEALGQRGQVFVYLNVEKGAGVDPEKISVEVERTTRRMARKAGRPLPSRGGR